jgi:rhodanese-related sulfurtransferase
MAPAEPLGSREARTGMRLPWWLPIGSVPEVTAATLAARLAGGEVPQLVDVRSHFEFRAGHIAGAVNVPITDARDLLSSLALDSTRPVVAICLTAHRSIPAVRLLQRAGFDAAQLAGGMLAWRAAGLPETNA